MLSKSIFAFNPRLKNSSTGEIEKKYHRGYAEPATVGQIMDMMFGGVSNLKAIVEAIREGHEELKEELPFLCPHYSRFRGNHRAQADIVPQEFTHKTCVDVDDPELVPTAIKNALEANKNPFSDFEGLVEYIEYSARKKVHIWIRLPKGMTIAEAQQAFCQEIEVPYDESCTTPERFIYMTGDQVYRSEKWLQPLTDEDIAERREAYLNRGLDVDGRPLKEPDAKPKATQQLTASTLGKSLEVVPPDKRTRFIFEEIMKKEGLTAADLNEEGGRHNAVKMILSHATQLLKEGEFMGVLSELMPSWQEKEFQ